MKGLIFTYALVGMGALWSLRKPQIGLYVYIAFAMLRPQSLWSWSGNFGPISLIVAVPMLVGWAIHGFGSWRFEGGRRAVGALLLFTAWTFLSALLARDTQIGWTALLNLLRVVAPVMVGITTLTSVADAEFLLWIIVACQGYVALTLNESYFFQGINVVRDIGFGTMDNNSFAISLVSTVGPAFALGLVARRWLPRLAAFAASALILHAALLTFSRGAFVGLCAVGVSAVLLMPKRPTYILALTVAILLAVRLTGPELAARFATTFAADESRDQSAESRIDLWRDCLTVAAAHPLFGIGPNNWPLVASEFGWPEGKQAHSVWMQGAAEVGFIGIVSLMGFYILTIMGLRPLLRARQQGDPRPLLAIGVITGVVGYVVSAQFVSLQGLETPYYLCIGGLVLLRASAQESRAQTADEKPQENRDRQRRVSPNRHSPKGPATVRRTLMTFEGGGREQMSAKSATS